MVRLKYLVLHKTEWDRLQKQGGPPPEEPLNIQKEYLEALTEKSREWMKSWPDSVSGHVALMEKQKKKQHKADMAFIKACTNKVKQDNTAAAIKEAKQLIFEDSSYGRKLLSALLESRALDVRDAQIKLQKELQQRAAEIAKEQETSKKAAFYDFHDNDAERDKIKKLTALECDKTNKEIISLKKEKELQTKLEEQKCAIEGEKLMKQILEIEEKTKEDIKRCEKQAIEEFEAEKNKIAEIKARDKKLNEALTNLYKKEQDKIKSKIQAVMKKAHQSRLDTKWPKNLYEKVDRIHKEENKRYDDFVNTGIEKYEKRTSKKEAKEMAKEKQNSSSRYLTAQRNKIAAEERLAKKCENKCACDRQSLIMKTSKKTMKTGKISNEESLTKTKTKTQQDSLERPDYIENLDEEKKKKLAFLLPRNKLLKELKKRQKEPSPWNGTKEMHKQFAQQANEVLKEIKHKHFARKVVDEYRKLNCLDATTLPVPNY